MKLHVTGLNHRTAPLDVRERMAFAEASLAEALGALKNTAGVEEGMILSTCNRVEVAVAVDDQAEARALTETFLSESHQLDSAGVLPYLYHFEDREAIQHLFRVAASLDSMVLGEPQILGQLKTAYATAKEHGALGGFLDAVLTRAFSVAKRVRSETEIGKSAVSVSYAAVELARKIFGTLEGRKVMVVGAGKMSELAARHLRRSGVSGIYVANRTRERAEQMAALFQGVIVDYEKFVDVLPEMDIVITSSGAPHYILTRNDVKRVLDRRRNRPMFLIDIAVPRNIEPAVNGLDNAFLYDIDDLEKVVDSNRHERTREAGEAEKIIADEVERMLARLKVREVAPTIVSLQEQLEQIRAGEIERVRGKLGTLTPEQEEAIEALTRGIVHKIAHGPISELRKHAGNPEESHLVELIQRVFRLGG
jgi:glutamyl-tRNA reductase